MSFYNPEKSDPECLVYSNIIFKMLYTYTDHKNGLDVDVY